MAHHYSAVRGVPLAACHAARCATSERRGAPLLRRAREEQVVHVGTRGGQDVPERGEQHPHRHDDQAEVHRGSPVHGGPERAADDGPRHTARRNLLGEVVWGTCFTDDPPGDARPTYRSTVQERA